MSETLRHEGGASRASAHFIGISAILAMSCGASTAFFVLVLWSLPAHRARVAWPLATAAIWRNGAARGARRTGISCARNLCVKAGWTEDRSDPAALESIAK